jgi:hypothetical protein
MAADLERLWVYVGPDMGGFGDVQSFVSPPSLYETAWTLRIATAAGIVVPALSRPEMAGWLMGFCTRRQLLSSPFPPLETLWLAAQALHALGKALPSPCILAQTRALAQRGGLFAFAPKQPASWAATDRAAQLFSDAGLQVPPATLTATLAAIHTFHGADVPAQWVNVDLPLWNLADQVVPAAFRWHDRVILAGFLQRVVTAIQKPPLTGEDLAILSTVRAIQRANDLPLVAFDGHWYAQNLMTPNGMLAAAAGSVVPDPQATYYGLQLGIVQRARIASAIQVSAWPMGWPAPITDVNPQSTFEAVAIEQALGITIHPHATQQLARAWIHLLTMDAQSATTLKPALVAMYYTVALAHQLGIALPQTAMVNLLRVLTVTPGSTWSLPQLFWLVRLTQELGTELPGSLQQRVQTLAQHTPVVTVRSSFIVWTISRAIGDSLRARQAITIIPSLQTGMAFRSTSAIRIPDLLSTAEASAMLDRAEPLAACWFATHQGFEMFPPGQYANLENLETLYLGLWLLRQVPNATGVF